MRFLQTVLCAAICSVLIFSSCGKEEIIAPDNTETFAPLEQFKEVPKYDESNSPLLTWDALPDELRNAKPLPLETEAVDSRGDCYWDGIAGPWGGNGGYAFGYEPSACQRVYAMAIRSGAYIDKLTIWYKDGSGNVYLGLDEGGNGGSFHLHFFSDDEYIYAATGRAGAFLDKLSVYTNKKSFSYGGNGGSSFVAFQPNREILGFFGRSGAYIDRLGFCFYDL